MMPPFPHGSTVTVTRRTQSGTDAYNNPTYTTTTHTVEGCGVAPRQEGDVTDAGRQGVMVGLTLYAPHGADIQADDIITVNAEDFRIEGDPGVWSQPMTGWNAGMVVPLIRAEG